MSDETTELALAAEFLDDTDAAVLAAVRRSYERADPLPDGLIERIQFELTLDALHAEIAELTRLDLVGGGVRASSTEAVRTVTFTSESLTTMITLTPQPDGLMRIDGWVTPGAGVGVEVHLPSGTSRTVADADGRFVFEGLAGGLAKFILQLPDGSGGTTVVSPTIEL